MNRVEQSPTGRSAPGRTFTLIGADRVPFQSGVHGLFGGHRRSRI